MAVLPEAIAQQSACVGSTPSILTTHCDLNADISMQMLVQVRPCKPCWTHHVDLPHLWQSAYTWKGKCVYVLMIAAQLIPPDGMLLPLKHSSAGNHLFPASWVLVCLCRLTDGSQTHKNEIPAQYKIPTANGRQCKLLKRQRLRERHKHGQYLLRIMHPKAALTKERLGEGCTKDSHHPTHFHGRSRYTDGNTLQS